MGPALMESYVVRALQDFGASCSDVATAVADWDKSTGGAGTANTLSELVERAIEFDQDRDVFCRVVLNPLVDPKKTLALIVEEQDHVERRRMRGAAWAAAAKSQLKALAPLPEPNVTASNSRALGGLGPEALDEREVHPGGQRVESASDNLSTLTTRRERRLAAAAVGGRCLGFLSADGCPRPGGCHFRHTVLTPEEQRSVEPVVTCVLAAGGGPRWAPLPEGTERMPVVTALRQSANLTSGRGAPSPGTHGTLRRHPGGQRRTLLPGSGDAAAWFEQRGKQGRGRKKSTPRCGGSAGRGRWGGGGLGSGAQRLSQQRSRSVSAPSVGSAVNGAARTPALGGSTLGSSEPAASCNGPGAGGSGSGSGNRRTVVRAACQ